MASAINNRNISGVPINTTDATATVTGTILTDNDTSFYVEATILATETTDHDETGAYKIAATFKNDGGTLTQVGTTTALVTHENTAGWAVDFAISGETIQIRVTGAATTNVSWVVSADVKSLKGYIGYGALIGS